MPTMDSDNVCKIEGDVQGDGIGAFGCSCSGGC
jgi:hypothetical protein